MLTRILSHRLRNLTCRSSLLRVNFPISARFSASDTKTEHDSGNSAEAEHVPSFLDNFFEDCRNWFKKLFPVALGLFIFKYFLCVPIIGRSMSPQFNNGIADFGDTVIVIPRILRNNPLKRGQVYLFNDPSGR